MDCVKIYLSKEQYQKLNACLFQMGKQTVMKDMIVIIEPMPLKKPTQDKE